MELLSIKYFLCVAESESFAKAAEALFVSRQALSQQILRLEKFYGVKLFIRNNPVELTKEGKILQFYARQVFVAFEDANSQIKSLSDMKQETITVGMSRHRSQVYLPLLYEQFKPINSKLRFKLYDSIETEIEKDFLAGKIEMMIGPSIDYVPYVKKVEGWQEHLVLMIPDNIFSQLTEKDKKILYSGKTLKWQALVQFPFLKMKHTNWLGKLFDDICKEENIKADIALESGNICTLINMCVAGAGIFLALDPFLLRETEVLKANKVHLFRYNLKTINKICISYLETRYLSKMSKVFIEHMEQVNKFMDKKLANIPYDKLEE